MRFGKPEGVDRNRNGLVAGLSAIALSMATMGTADAEGDWRVRTKDGGTMPARDFRKGPGVRASDYTPRNYEVSYPPSNGIIGGDFPDYALLYTPDGSFTVAIEKEPIGPNRLRASRDLAARLGLTLKDLCRLVANVGAPGYASREYGGRELGFPGCKGSVRFPGDPQF